MSEFANLQHRIDLLEHSGVETRLYIKRLQDKYDKALLEMLEVIALLNEVLREAKDDKSGKRSN